MRDALIELLVFGLKQVRACTFVALFFAGVLLVPRTGFRGIARYDLLLIIAVAIQAWMLWSKLETLDGKRPTGDWIGGIHIC